MPSSSIAAIDVHAHYGVYTNSALEIRNRLMSAELPVVLQRAQQARISLSIITSIESFRVGRESDVLGTNNSTAQLARQTHGVCHWVVVNPLQRETYTQAAELLKHPRCAGIKIHPIAHAYKIVDYAMEIFAFAAEQQTVVQSHTGEECCLPEDYVAAANAFPEVPVILSHLGCGYDGDLAHQVRAIQRSAHGNLYTDTSSANSITANLIEWAVQEVGPEHILFGTDTPLYFTPMQRARIDYADISEDARRLILRDNALRLFQFSEELVVNL